MKTKIISKALLCALTLSLGLRTLLAQETNEVERLRRQLRQWREDFEKIQQQQRQQIEALQRQIDALEQKQGRFAPPSFTPAAEPLPQPSQATSAPSAGSALSAKKPWSPSDPIRLGGQRAYMNVGLGGLVAAGTSTASDLERLQPGGHDPARRGFTMQNLELSLDGMVDPYFRAQANLLFTGGGGHGGGVEVEEAWLETLALPGNLQLRAGQLMTEFGRHNPTHPHTWAFADQPLVMGRMFGADGLRNPGARLSWLVPTPFYSELCLTLQNSQGDTAFSFRNDHEGARLFGRPTHEGRVRTFSDLLFTPRYAMSFDLTENQTLLLGVSAAFGPNGSGPKAASQVYGVDWFWKWKSSHHHGGFPFVAWQSEVLWRRYRAGAFAEDVNSNGFLDPSELDLNGNGLADLALPRELLTDYGFYSQISWGFTKGWVAALRGDYVAGNRGQYENSLGLDPDRARRWRLSPNLTWYPSEFSKIRLQYNYDDRRGLGGDHSLWLQLEFLLGAHGAHKF